MNICIFCSAQEVPEKYSKPAEEFSRLLAEGGHVLVWGGSNVGVMKLVADAAESVGGKLIGISTEKFRHKARQNVHVMEFTQNLSERKTRLAHHADAFVALPGGIGTLDEIAEVLALKRNLFHTKPIVFLNTDNFYEGLHAQFQKMHQEGFLADRDGDHRGGLSDLVYFADTPKDGLRYIENSLPKAHSSV